MLHANANLPLASVVGKSCPCPCGFHPSTRHWEMDVLATGPADGPERGPRWARMRGSTGEGGGISEVGEALCCGCGPPETGHGLSSLIWGPDPRQWRQADWGRAFNPACSSRHLLGTCWPAEACDEPLRTHAEASPGPRTVPRE